jgi:hypothetical protein
MSSGSCSKSLAQSVACQAAAAAAPNNREISHVSARSHFKFRDWNKVNFHGTMHTD